MLNLLKTRYKSIVDKIKKIHYEKIKISKKPVIKNKKSLKISNKKKQTNKKAKKKLLLKNLKKQRLLYFKKIHKIKIIKKYKKLHYHYDRKLSFLTRPIKKKKYNKKFKRASLKIFRENKKTDIYVYFRKKYSMRRKKRAEKKKYKKSINRIKSTFWKYTQKPVISRLKKYMSFLQKKYNKLTYLKSMQLLYFNNIKSKDTNTIKFRSKKKKKKKGIIKSALVKELHKKKKKIFQEMETNSLSSKNLKRT